MRVFVTGATGFIGSATVAELLDAGHEVTGLARSEKAEKRLVVAGAKVLRGGIEDLAALRRGAERADGVVHTAFFHELGQMGLGTRLGVFFGGAPGGIMLRYAGAAVKADRRALETLGKALKGDGRPLVAAFGTMGLTAGRLGIEDDAFDPASVGGMRGGNETVMQALAARGVRTSVIRLPPVVHGAGDIAGFMPRLIDIARKKKVSIYVGDGGNRWGAVHRLDAARLFRLALENGPAGGVYHAVAEEGMPFRDIAAAIGKGTGVPVASRTQDQAAKSLSWLSLFAGVDNPASSVLTQERLGWRPGQAGLLADLQQGGYFQR